MKRNKEFQLSTSLDPPSTQPPTSSDPPLVQPPTSLDLPPLQLSTSSDPPSVQLLTYLGPLSIQSPTSSDPLSMPTTPYVDPLSLHLDASLSTPLGPEFRTSVLPSPEPSIFVPMSMQIDTSTQLDLPPTILRGRQGLCQPKLLPPPPTLFLAPIPSQTDVLHVSHVVPVTVIDE
ncbi:hypothetical protein CK203_105275 [Vitis vinifera]|uniref:Uncharacterized protein n=1 Tax=Vitis vinifera TaxID=29760 RepID=A0A438CIJ7_VITVI|nr:hypothetical protein CK203_105275 [Vitis vinifera]